MSEVPFLKKMLDLVLYGGVGWFKKYLEEDGLEDDDEEVDEFGMDIREEKVGCISMDEAMVEEENHVACGIDCY